MIHLARPLVEEDDRQAVLAVLDSGMLVQGARVAAFEEALAEVIGVRHVIAVSSGTAALHLALLALDVGPGSRVAVPAYSWPATANVVAAVGATPVFVDIDVETYALRPDRLEEAGKVDVVLPVHPFGQMADLSALAGSPALVEDAACALGARRDGRSAGSVGRAGCFSFHPRKAITTCEGGALSTDDDDLADRLRAWRNHGLQAGASTPEFVLPGLNYRLTEMQAALGVTQLGKLDRILATRRAQAAAYTALLESTDIAAPVVPAGSEPVHQSYVVLLPEGTPPGDVIAHTRAHGVETQIGTWHIPLTRYYRERYGFAAGDFPGTDEVFRRALTLPLGPHLGEGDLVAVVDAVQAAVRAAG